MASPVLELQGAIVAALKADATIDGLVGDRIYDPVPAAAAFPYVSIGAASELNDGAECIDAVEITLRIDAWSRTSGRAEVLRIAEAVKQALHDENLLLTDNALVFIRHQRTDHLRDPDGLTRHSVVEFIASVEQP